MAKRRVSTRRKENTTNLFAYGRFSALCKVCDEKFRSRTSKAKYCSDACKQTAYRARMTEKTPV